MQCFRVLQPVFLDKKVVQERVLNVVKNFEKVRTFALLRLHTEAHTLMCWMLPIGCRWIPPK